MSDGSDVLILCEGYDDRSFWKGLLLRMGSVDERKLKGKRYQKTDVYAFRSPGGAVVYVVPAQQSIGLLELAKDELQSRVEKPFSRMILNLDIDARTVEDARRSIASTVREVDGAAVEQASEFLLDGGRTRVAFVPWFLDLPAPLDGVPQQQTLERMVCAALARVYPARAAALAEWIRGRPEPAGKEHKAHAWSFYAGWYTRHGTGFFYESIWKDASVAAELESMLRASGVWRILDLAVNGTKDEPTPAPSG